MTIAVGIFAAFLWSLIIYWWWRWNRNQSPIRNWPVIGMLPGLRHNARRIHEYLAQVLKESGYTVAIKRAISFSNTDYVLTSDPANVHHILSRNFANYSKRPKFKMIMELSGDGIFSAEDDLWKILHAMIKHRKYESALEKVIRQKLEKGLIPVLEHVSKLGLVMDLQDVFQRFNFDSNSQMILGFDPNSLSVEFPRLAYEKAYDDMVEGAIRRHLVPQIIWKLKWLQIGKEKKFLRAWKTFDRFIYNCISLKREKLSRKPQMEEEQFDFLTAFVVKEEEIQVKEDI